MIDYEITVNVEGLTRDEKKRVQDAFFKLGITWWDGKKHGYLGKGCYTNKTVCGEVTQALMWTDVSTKPTHTVDQLLELAGMKKQNTTSFDLERALAGEPVVTRNGKEVTQLTLFETSSKYALAGVVDGSIIKFTKEGTYYYEGDSHERDLFMKPKTHKLNGFEVPAPITNPENMKFGDTYYVADITGLDWCFQSNWANDEVDGQWMDRNLVFLNKEDAIANAKAMAGVNPL